MGLADQIRSWMPSKGMYDRTRIHAGQPHDKSKSGLDWDKAQVAQDVTDNALVTG